MHASRTSKGNKVKGNGINGIASIRTGQRTSNTLATIGGTQPERSTAPYGLCVRAERHQMLPLHPLTPSPHPSRLVFIFQHSIACFSTSLSSVTAPLVLCGRKWGLELPEAQRGVGRGCDHAWAGLTDHVEQHVRGQNRTLRLPTDVRTGN
eukprot:3203899-Rhodomonas_salina.5